MRKCCKKNNAEKLREYIEACVVDINKPIEFYDGEEYSSLLGIAARYNSLDCLKILLENGADINAKDHLGITPLGDAVYQENVEAVKLLLEYNPDVNVQDNDGRTPLYLAVENGSVECMKLLLNVEGIDVNIQTDDYFRYTILHKIAIDHLDEEMIFILLEHGADYTIRDRYKKSFLNYIEDKKLKKEIKEYIKNMEAYKIKCADE